MLLSLSSLCAGLYPLDGGVTGGVARATAGGECSLLFAL